MQWWTDDLGPTVPPHMSQVGHGRTLTIFDPPAWMGPGGCTRPSGPMSLSTGPHRLTSTMEPATGFHDARDSVREAAVRGQGTRTDRAYRRGLRGRGQR